MDAWIITLKGNEYSERVAQRCIDSANIEIKTYPAVHANAAHNCLATLGLKWTWGPGYNGMQHKPYGGNEEARIACFLSHYLLWEICAHTERPMMILEHDAVFIRPFEPFPFRAICMLNDPLGATSRGDWWSERMEQRGPGVWPKTKVFDWTRPDGLAGNSAYVIKPHAARELVYLAHKVGAWPNDALMCRQLIDGLEEVYPFFTEVRAEQSTI